MRVSPSHKNRARSALPCCRRPSAQRGSGAPSRLRMGWRRAQPTRPKTVPSYPILTRFFLPQFPARPTLELEKLCPLGRAFSLGATRKRRSPDAERRWTGPGRKPSMLFEKTVHRLRRRPSSRPRVAPIAVPKEAHHPCTNRDDYPLDTDNAGSDPRGAVTGALILTEMRTSVRFWYGGRETRTPTPGSVPDL